VVLLAVRLIELPLHTGLLLPAFSAGVGFTTTATVAAGEVQLPSFAVTL
jgi:hypothetical protein